MSKDQTEADRPALTSYFDILLCEMDRWIRPELQSDQSKFYYRAFRRIMARFIADGQPAEAPDEFGIAPVLSAPHGGSFDSLRDSVEEEGRRIDDSIRVGNERLASYGEVTIQPGITRESIEAELHALGHAGAQVADYHVVVGGRSKETILFTAEGLDGLPRNLVMRRDLVAGSLGTRVIDEYELLKVLHASGVAVPEPFVSVETAAEIGTSFLLLEAVSGRTVGEAVFPPSTVEQTLDAARALARVHMVRTGDVAAMPSVGRTTRPHSELLADVETLETLWSEHARSPSATIEAVFSWMKAHAPEIRETRCLVHGDYNFHNLLYEGDRLTAVLDWELTHIGHPGEDLGYIKQCVEMVASWDDFMAAYNEAGGCDVSRNEVHFFMLFSQLRLVSYIFRARTLLETGQSDSIQRIDSSTFALQRILHHISLEMRQILRER